MQISGDIGSVLSANQQADISEAGIASGYPEEQRELKSGGVLSTLASKFVACTATLQVTAKGKLLLQDPIDDHKEIDVLSGMSGGPIIWSNSDSYGLAGIVEEGLDIQSKTGSLVVGNGIWIHGELITIELFEEWTQQIPPLSALKDETKSLYVPEGFS